MKIIPIEKAVKLAHDISKEACLTQRESNIFDLIMASIKPIDLDGKQFFKLQDLQNFLLNFKDAVEQKDFSWLTQKRGLKVDRIVSIEEFIKGSDYLHQGKRIRPRILQGLNEFWDPENGYVEAVLTGSTSWGKNFFSRMSLAYMIYILSCYWNPQLDFDLGLGSSIILINQSKTERLAKRVMFGQFAQMLQESPYFQKVFKYDQTVKSELRFPRNIYVLPVGGSDEAALGMDVWGGIIDELNFMERTVDSVHTRFTGGDEYDQAERAYNSLFRRMKGRFVQKGGMLPGKLLLISAVNYVGDFTDKKKREMEEEIKKTGKSFTFFMSLAQWESIPKERFSGETFFVELGDGSRRSKILENKNDVTIGSKIIEVPIEYKSDFERDIEGSLKDFAGEVTGTSYPFIPYKELITKAEESYKEKYGGQTLFLKPIIFLSVLDQYDIDWSEIVNHDYIENNIIVKDSVFTVHIDLGLNKKKGDAVGLDIGRIVGYKTLPSYKYYDERKDAFVEVDDVLAPIYQIDGVLQIKAKVGDEVDFNQIRDLVLYLRGYINLKWGTTDTYQNVMLRQAFKRAKMRTGDLSVDTSLAPYTELKLAIKDERIFFPYHPILHKELCELQKGEKKVDHPQEGTKDVSDGCAGVVYILQHKEANYKGHRRGRQTREEKEQVREIQTPRRRRKLRIL